MNGDIINEQRNISVMSSPWIDWYSTIAQSLSINTERNNIDLDMASPDNELITLISSSTSATAMLPMSLTTTLAPHIVTEPLAEVPYEDYKYRPETYIVPIIFGIIFVAGLMGNGMLIAVFVKHRAMRNVPNT